MENRVQELDWRWTQISELNFNGLAVWDLQYSLFGIFATQISLIHLRPFLLNLSYITTGVKSLSKKKHIRFPSKRRNGGVEKAGRWRR